MLSRAGTLSVKDAPYEFLARELVGFAALQAGDNVKAREQYGYLESIPGVPATIKERAKQALSLMRTSAALESPAEMTKGSATESNIEEPALETTRTNDDE